jgi:hypothetical protein
MLGTLITRAHNMAQDLTRRPHAISTLWITIRFGTQDIALILARLSRGLRLAAALYAALPEEPKPQRAPRQRPQPETPDFPWPDERPEPPARPEPMPLRRNQANDPFATLPTAHEIAALLRDRSIGDILTEICTELGIMTQDLFWNELEQILAENDADIQTVVQDAEQRLAVGVKFVPADWFPLDLPEDPDASLPEPAPAEAVAEATGPP